MRTPPLHGRDELLGDLWAMLQGHGIVTLVGPGGVGKTCLAEAILARRTGTLVGLEHATAADDVVRALAHSLSLDGDRLLEALRSSPPRLVVLDNCEQLTPAARSWLEDAIPDSWTVLATSRRPLRWAGEQVVEVPLLGESPSAQVFLDAAPSGFVVDDAHRACLARILERLEGLPLALELAAGRLDVVDLPTLESLLADRYLKTLADPEQQGRHASIDDAVDWSWGLLEPAQQEALVACGAFGGPFPLRGAAVVMDDPLDHLHVLVRRHLLVVEEGRYRLLEPVRQFVATRSGELPSAHLIRRKVLRWLAGEAVGWAEAAKGPSLPIVLQQAADEWAGLTMVIAEGDAEEAHAAFYVLARVVEVRGPAAEGVRWATQLTERSELPPRVRATALAWRSRWLRRTGAVDRAEADANAAIALAEGTDDALARALMERAAIRLQRGVADVDARKQELERAFAVVRDRSLRVILLANFALVLHDEKRHDEVDTLLEEALEAADQVGNPIASLNVHAQAATIHLERPGDHAPTRAHLQRAQELAGTLGLRRKQAFLTGQLALTSEATDPLQAMALYDEAIQGLQATGDAVNAAANMGFRAQLELVYGDRTLARTRLEEAAAILEGAGDDRLRRYVELHLALEAALREDAEAIARWSGEPRLGTPREQALSRLVESVAQGMAGAARHDLPAVEGAIERAMAIDPVDGSPEPLVLWAVGQLRAAAGRWTVATDGSWFEDPSGQRASLNSAANARILHHLAARRNEAPGAASTVEDLAAAGWPGERLVAKSAGNRVRVALSRLRREGLAELIERGEAGWRLDPNVDVRRSDSP